MSCLYFFLFSVDLFQWICFSVLWVFFFFWNFKITKLIFQVPNIYRCFVIQFLMPKCLCFNHCLQFYYCRTVTGKIGNIHHLWFYLLESKFDDTIQWTETNLWERRHNHRIVIPISRLILNPPVSRNEQEIFMQDICSK